MNIELSTIENLLIRHALGCYIGMKGYRKNPILKADMQGIKLKLAQADIGFDVNFLVGTGKAVGK